MKKRWVSTNDDRTRSHHSAMNGVEVDLEADFEVPYKGVTYKMKHAGDPRGPSKRNKLSMCYPLCRAR